MPTPPSTATATTPWNAASPSSGKITCCSAPICPMTRRMEPYPSGRRSRASRRWASPRGRSRRSTKAMHGDCSISKGDPVVTDYESLIEPVKNKRTFEEVSDRLKELIFNGTLKPGQQLPSEPALAQIFHVGRQSVREALRVLEISGFITVRPGAKGGAMIESTMLSKLSGLFLETFRLHKISIEDCIAARKAIEASVIDLAIQNAGEEDIEALRNNIVVARKKLH